MTEPRYVWVVFFNGRAQCVHVTEAQAERCCEKLGKVVRYEVAVDDQSSASTS